MRRAVWIERWAFAGSLALAALPAIAQPALPIDRIRLPPGFAIEVAARVPNARAMTWGAEGTLFVGSVNGLVHAVSFPAGRPSFSSCSRTRASRSRLLPRRSRRCAISGSPRPISRWP